MNNKKYMLAGTLLLCGGMSAWAQSADSISKGSTPSDRLPLAVEASPRSEWGYGNSLHAGLNASMDLSAYTTFGGRRHRSGLAQTVNVAYATPLGKKGSLVVGGDISHVHEGSNHYVNGSLYAELGYQFNEHWTASVYGQKSFGNSGLYPGYGWGDWGYPSRMTPYGCGLYGYGLGWGTGYYSNPDRLGATVRWTPSPSFSMQLSVEKDWYHDPYKDSTFGPYKYSYPLPKVQ